MRKFDLIVIGSGSELEVSSEASDAGWPVAVVEEGPFSGSCLNRGCIPSKMLSTGRRDANGLECLPIGIQATVERVDRTFILRRNLQGAPRIYGYL